MNQLTFLSEEPPVKTTVLDTQPGQALQATAWMVGVLASPLLSQNSQTGLALNGLFGKMCRMSYRGGIPAAFCGSSPTLRSSGIFAHGGCWTNEISAPPTNLAHVCSWSEIVQTLDDPQQFYLSRRALAGIARRDRKPRLFSPQEGEWLSMTERHAFWMDMGRELPPP